MALEIMSPAGSFESVVAAVRSGADAVYFGAGDFNARRNAKNLSDEELAEAIRYCHLRGVKTYITVNTLVTDRELEKAKELILHLNRIGADALKVTNEHSVNKVVGNIHHLRHSHGHSHSHYGKGHTAL